VTYSDSYCRDKAINWALHVARNPWGWCEDDADDADGGRRMTDVELKQLLQVAGFHNADSPYEACGTIQNFRKLVELLKEADDELHKDAYESFGKAAATMKDFGIAAGAAASGVDTFCDEITS